jgi:dihydroorotate dehydrogenase (fumarate)
MIELYSRYMGLDLTSPLIAGSCNLTDSLENLKAIESAGAGAVILKSVFEEEITFEFAQELEKLGPMGENLEFLDYFDSEIRQEKLNRYLTLISDAKSSLKIPVIASINCVTSHEWSFFAKKIEAAGADGIELNISTLPSGPDQESTDYENTYFEIIRRVTEKLQIPISVKISPYFSNPGRMISRLSETGISGIALFNRFYSPDIDIDKVALKSASGLSCDTDYLLPLRWIGIMSNCVKCGFSATSGIHDWQTVVKMLLAGARTVQLVSVLYRNGFETIAEINRQVATWMDFNDYVTLDDFRGKLAMGKNVNPAAYERIQFMKTFGGKG